MKKIYLTLGAVALASISFADTAVFNDMPSGSYFTGAYGGSNVFGEYYGLSDASNNPITGFDTNFVTSGTAGTSTNYSDLQLQVSFFTTGQSGWTGSGNEFGGLGVSQTYNFGNETLANGYYWDAAGLLNGGTEITLSTAQAVSGNVIGVQFAWLNNVNGVATPVTTICEAVSGSAPAIGSNAQTAYSMCFYGIANNSQTSLTESQYIYTGGTLNLATELFASSTPEPGSMAVLGLGIVGLIARRRRRASK